MWQYLKIFIFELKSDHCGQSAGKNMTIELPEELREKIKEALQQEHGDLILDGIASLKGQHPIIKDYKMNLLIGGRDELEKVAKKLFGIDLRKE